MELECGDTRYNVQGLKSLSFLLIPVIRCIGYTRPVAPAKMNETPMKGMGRSAIIV